MESGSDSQPSLLLSIGDMIDLSIGSPEVGVVDFNMLQTVLHCLAQQLHILEKNVELKGTAASIMPYDKNKGHTVAVDEFIITTENDGTAQPKIVVKEILEVSQGALPLKIMNNATGKSTGGDPKKVDTMLVVNRIRKPQQDAFSRDYTEGSVFNGSTGGGPAGSIRFHSEDGHRASKVSGGGGKSSDGTTVMNVKESERGGSTTSQGGAGHSPTRGASGKGQTVMVAMAGESDHKSSVDGLKLVTASQFNLLNDTVSDLKNKVYGTIPKNEEILEEVRSQTNIKAITDMWTNLNVKTRLEAAEQGITKLSSLLQDVISDKPINAEDLDLPKLPTADGGTEGVGGAIDQEKSMGMQGEIDKLNKSVSIITSKLMVCIDLLQNNIDEETAKELLQGIDDGTKSHGGGAADKASGGGQGSDGQACVDGDPCDEERPSGSRRQSLAVSKTDSQMKADAARRKLLRPPKAEKSNLTPLIERLTVLEEKFEKCCGRAESDEGDLRNQLQSFQDQIDYLAKDIAKLTEDLASGKLSPELIRDLQGLVNMFETVQAMQNDLKQVSNMAQQLAAEKEDRQHHVKVMAEQIEMLKTIKMDREDMVEAMADKADLRLLTRKVSRDQFEMACDDLSKGLSNALGKLSMQESLWQQALDDIQREIETKLDKMELSPVKDFFYTKLKQLQDHLKQMVSLRREAEAAGTKRKLLRDVNCISCDAKAVMPMEATIGFQSKPSPPSASIKPYLTYELDTIRKQQASNVPQRNMHDWETIDKQMGPQKSAKVRSDADKHIVNRYCGGSHTTTTPAQRVSRTGHFVKQWGPDVVPLSTGFAMGEDGRLYKVADLPPPAPGPPGASGPGSEKSKSKYDAPAPSQKSLPISEIGQGCRCMEDQPKQLPVG